MPEKHKHFPTFDRIAKMPVAGQIVQSFRSERGLLRLALYLMLLVSGSHIFASRTFAYQTGMLSSMPWTSGRALFGEFPNTDPGAFLSILLIVTFTILGPAGAELAPAIMVVCLAGLAATTRADRGQKSGAQASVGHATVTAGPLEPEPPPPPRHPLDLDPTDSPLEPRWPKRSPPSR